MWSRHIEGPIWRDPNRSQLTCLRPARTIRRRYEDADVERLVRAAWWDWPVELVTEHVRTIMTGSPADIEAVAIQAGRV
ncbi:MULTISPECIES: hypothetical protein [Microbispora]|uniref:hypothetical protein n=1 Tax=Microbispora TaxID=2005 RepID=UPI0033D50C3D